MHRLESLIDECQIHQFHFSKWFDTESVVEATSLENARFISAWILDSPALQTAVAALGHPFDVAVLGWMDQAVLEIPYRFDGVTDLKDAAIKLDSLDLDQSGDSALLVTHDWQEFLLVYVEIDDNCISVDRLRRQTIPTAGYRLIHPAESELVGRRAAFLVGAYLVPVGQSSEGGATLFRDPTDLRLWELTYPNGASHGEGPPMLRCVESAGPINPLL